MQALAEALGVQKVNAQVLSRKPGDILVISLDGNVKRSKIKKTCQEARAWLDSREQTRDLAVMVHNGSEYVRLQGPESSDKDHICEWTRSFDDLSASYYDLSDAKRELQAKHDATVAELTKLRGELIVKTNEHATKCREFTQASDALDKLRAENQTLHEKLQQSESNYTHMCDLYNRQSAELKEMCLRASDQAERLEEQDKRLLAQTHAETDLIYQVTDLAAETDSLRAQVSVAHDRIAELQKVIGLPFSLVARYNELLHLEVLVDIMLADVPMSGTLIQRLDWFMKWASHTKRRLPGLDGEIEWLKERVTTLEGDAALLNWLDVRRPIYDGERPSWVIALAKDLTIKSIKPAPKGNSGIRDQIRNAIKIAADIEFGYEDDE